MIRRIQKKVGTRREPTAAEIAAALVVDRQSLAVAEDRERGLRAQHAEAISDPVEYRRLGLEAREEAGEVGRLRAVVRQREEQYSAAVKQEKEATDAAERAELDARTAKLAAELQRRYEEAAAPLVKFLNELVDNKREVDRFNATAQARGLGTLWHAEHRARPVKYSGFLHDPSGPLDDIVIPGFERGSHSLFPPRRGN